MGSRSRPRSGSSAGRLPGSARRGRATASGSRRPIGRIRLRCSRSRARDRVAELVPMRHGRMLASPFTFFRGAALIMAADLAPTPRAGITVQLCGDAHLSNFGVFGSPERQMLFDINDFDETLPGPWEWDVKRLAASFEVCGRERGFSRRTGATIVDRRASRAYRTSDARGRDDANARRLVRPHRRRRDPGRVAAEVRQKRLGKKRGARGGGGRGQGEDARPACGSSRSEPTSWTASCGSWRTHR